MVYVVWFTMLGSARFFGGEKREPTSCKKWVWYEKSFRKINA